MRKYLYGFSSFVLAFAILSVSVVKTAAIYPAYGYSATPPAVVIVPTPLPQVEYDLPYGGKIMPDNWLWYAKVLRDKAQYLITTNATKKAELAVLFSDKRLGAALWLFENKKPDMAVSVLSKGEKYLEMAFKDEAIARQAGLNTNELVIKIATASLKHRQVIEEKILPLAPEDLKPHVIKAENYSVDIFKTYSDLLKSKGITPPKDPFNGQ